jgi:hypothetical protein
MKRIFKYPLPMEVDGGAAQWKDRFEIELPMGAEILSVQEQNNAPMLWALVDPEAIKEKRKMLLLNTGAEMPPDVNYHQFKGTYQLNGGRLVFHLFEDMDVPF